jgi:hypothetical protein
MLWLVRLLSQYFVSAVDDVLVLAVLNRLLLDSSGFPCISASSASKRSDC